MLQLSHVHSNVETFEGLDEAAATTEASIEPRSFERGNDLPALRFRYRLKASIEPRSFERGNSLFRIPMNHVAHSFN